MIHALLLSLVMAPQGGPVHADLHPAQTDLYIELGDLSTLWPALEQAPLVQLLHDERIKGLLAGLGQPAEFTLKGLLAEGLTKGIAETNASEWLDGLKTLSLSMLATTPAEGVSPLLFQAVADFSAPAQADAFKAVLLAQSSKHEPMTCALPGVEHLLMGDEPKDVWCATIGPRVVLCSSSAKVEDYVARADKKATGFGANEKFRKGLALLEKPSGTPVFWFALSRSLVDILRTAEPQGDKGADFLSELPSELNPFSGARVARMQMNGNRFVTELVSTDDGASDGAGRPIDPSWLEPVPNQTMLFYSTAFDGASAGKKMRALLAKDEQSAASLAAIEQKLGFGPERVLTKLGPGLTAYSAHLAGLGLPEMRLWLDCEDPAAFRADLEALVGALGETLPGFQAKTKPYKVKNEKTGEKVEVPVTTLTLPQGMIEIPMISLSPSFAPVGKKLVFGLNSLDVKNELKRVYGGEDESIKPGANPLAARGFALPEGARSVVVMDWGELLSGVLGMVKTFGAMSPEALPFDLAKLPPAEIFGQYFKPTFHYSKGVPGGLYRRNEASFGPETWLGLAGAAAMIGKQQSREIAPSGLEPMPTEELAPPKPVAGGNGG